jgi:hypothetical protein
MCQTRDEKKKKRSIPSVEFVDLSFKLTLGAVVVATPEARHRPLQALPSTLSVSDDALGQPDRNVARRGHSPSAGVEGKHVTASNSK